MQPASGQILIRSFGLALAIHLGAAGAVHLWERYAHRPDSAVRIVRYAELVALPIEPFSPPRISPASDPAMPLRAVSPARVPETATGKPLSGPSGAEDDYLAAPSLHEDGRTGEWNGAPTGVLIEPVVVHSVTPVYPAGARAASIQGLVEILALVSEQGVVETARISRADDIQLADAALAAIYGWVFRPALEGDHACAVWVMVPFRFSLLDSLGPRPGPLSRGAPLPGA